MTTGGSLRITVANPRNQRYAQQGYATSVLPFCVACRVYLPSKAGQDKFSHFTPVLTISKQGPPFEV